MKNILIITFICFTTTFFGQRERSTKIGQTTPTEVQMGSYANDRKAKALVLYEHANYYRDDRNNYRFATDYYKRIKIFDKDEAQDKTIINIYTGKDEMVKDIKGITYYLEDGRQKSIALAKDQIFTSQVNERVTKTSFTLPAIIDGAVIEYSYKITTPYLTIRDWLFQSDIPKLKSQFDLAILGNFQYNVRLTGFYDLDINKNSVKNQCMLLPDGGMSPCAIYSYGMNNSPAFEEEDYMLSKKNYLSRISLDLKSITSKTQVGAGYNERIETKVKNYTKTWKDADKALRLDFLNNQGSKKNFFKKKLSDEILSEADEFVKAKKIYDFIRDHYTWNEINWVSSDILVKESFEKKSGSVDEINLSLYNSLQAAKIESYITLVSTRENGMPTKLFPVITDFNYLIIKVVVNGEEHFLDATNKYRPFGQIPFKCLNGEARVFDFKKGSYWQNINKARRAERQVTYDLNFDNEGFIQAFVKLSNSRYFANEIRSKYYEFGEDEYIANKESMGKNFEIEDYKITDLTTLDKPVAESFTLISDDSFIGQENIKLSPIVFPTIKSNPFKLDDRLFPVDFGHQRFVTQRITVNLPEGYKVMSVPNDTGVKLPNNGGNYVFKVQNKGNQVRIYIRYQIAKKVFTSDEYFYLKEFFNKILNAEKGLIEIQKI
jgi:uncharacterized protein YcnI